jgi:protein-S-isoprenylcysteine O-methyltransferase Ste14
MNIFGAFLFSFLLAVRVSQIAQTGEVFPGLLLALQAGFAAYWMIFRKPALKESHGSIQLMAWTSAFVPLALQVSGVYAAPWRQWLSLPGLLLMLWAFWSLGGSFSIAPASRQLITSGPYRLIRHPMYAGEILSLFGLCLGSPSLWNWMVLSIFIVSIQARIVHEEALLERYPSYAQFVKWRMLPGVW